MVDEGEQKSAEAFLQLFAEVDEKQKKELFQPFLKGYRNGYRTFKRKFCVVGHHDNLRRELNGAITLVQVNITNAANETTNNSNKAACYGFAFGCCLSIVEHGITNPHFITEDSPHILKAFEYISKNIKEAGKKIRLDFIQRKIKKIAKEKGPLLSRDQKVLLSQIAELFAKS